MAKQKTDTLAQLTDEQIQAQQLAEEQEQGNIEELESTNNADLVVNANQRKRDVTFYVSHIHQKQDWENPSDMYPQGRYIPSATIPEIENGRLMNTVSYTGFVRELDAHISFTFGPNTFERDLKAPRSLERPGKFDFANALVLEHGDELMSRRTGKTVTITDQSTRGYKRLILASEAGESFD